jgi:phosphoribosylanthranilate isomerase
MSLFVKLCGIRTESDVAGAIKAGANAVGFVLSASPRRVDISEAARLADLVSHEMLTVAVFHRPGPRLLAETGEVLDPDLYQAEPHTLVGVPADRMLPVVVDGPGLGDRVGEALERSARGMVLVDRAARGGTGRGPDWDRVAALESRDRVILAGGLTPDNVAEAVHRVRPLGVDVSSGIERAPGEKDPGLMIGIVAAARAAMERGEAVR